MTKHSQNPTLQGAPESSTVGGTAAAMIKMREEMEAREAK